MGADLRKSVGHKMADGGVAAIVVEVARYQDGGIRAGRPHRVHSPAEGLRHVHAERLRAPLSSRAAGGMHHKHVERVAAWHHATGIEDVARGLHALHGRHTQRAAGDESKTVGRIEQGHVDAPCVGRGGHLVLVAGLAQHRPLREVAQAAVVLHLAEGHEVGQQVVGGRGVALPFVGRHDFLAYLLQFLPVAPPRPVMAAVGQELRVILQRVVLAVEEVLHVEFHERQQRGQDQLYHLMFFLILVRQPTMRPEWRFR